MNVVLGVTWVFTLAALVAVALHLASLREFVLDRKALKGKKVNGDLKRLADQFVHVESTRLFINLILVAVGIGALLDIRPVGWLLAFIPIISITASFINLHARSRQR